MVTMLNLIRLTKKWLIQECDMPNPTNQDISDQIVYGLSVYGTIGKLAYEMSSWFHDEETIGDSSYSGE